MQPVAIIKAILVKWFISIQNVYRCSKARSRRYQEITCLWRLMISHGYCMPPFFLTRHNIVQLISSNNLLKNTLTRLSATYSGNSTEYKETSDTLLSLFAKQTVLVRKLLMFDFLKRMARLNMSLKVSWRCSLNK